MKSVITAKLTRSNELVSHIAMFAAKSVKQETRTVEDDKKKEPKVEVTPLPVPSSDALDSAPSRALIRLR